MYRWSRASDRDTPPAAGRVPGPDERLRTDGGQEQDGDGSENASDPADADPGDGTDADSEEADADSEEADADSGEVIDVDDVEASSVGRSNVEVTEAGEAEPVDPKWEKPDLEDIPAVEGPKTRPADSNQADGPSGAPSDGLAGGKTASDADVAGSQQQGAAPTAGMPNTARSPGSTRLEEGAADGYVVALELCARLPDDVRLPADAADVVPAALEAELEQSVQQFAGEQFENPSPHVETLDFVEVDDDIWLRLRLGVPPEAFADLDPDEIQEHALQELDGLL